MVHGGVFGAVARDAQGRFLVQERRSARTVAAADFGLAHYRSFGASRAQQRCGIGQTRVWPFLMAGGMIRAWL